MGMVLNPLQRRIATGRECTIDRCLDLIEHEITRESHVPCLQHSQLAVSRVSSLSASQDLRRDNEVSTTLVRASLNICHSGFSRFLNHSFSDAEPFGKGEKAGFSALRGMAHCWSSCTEACPFICPMTTDELTSCIVVFNWVWYGGVPLHIFIGGTSEGSRRSVHFTDILSSHPYYAAVRNVQP